MLIKLTNLLSCLVLILAIVLTPVAAHAENSTTVEENIVLENNVNVNEVESYFIEVLSDELSVEGEGFYELEGYKMVNAITETTGNNDSITSTITSIEDNYDLNHNYINTTVKKDIVNNDYVNGTIDFKTYEKTLTTPKALKTKQSVLYSESAHKTNLNSEDKKALKKNIEGQFYNLSSFKQTKKSTKGLTKKDIKDLKEKILKADFDTNINNKFKQNKLVANTNNLTLASSLVQRKGAYDNYYNFNTSTTEFTIQALSASKHKYVRYTGKTLNNSKNAASFNNFKGYIDKYEEYIVKHMESNLFSVVTSWAFLIADLVVFVSGLGSGPAGWVAAISAAVSSLSLLRTFTSNTYATAYRASLSKTAQQYLKNAQSQMYYTNWSNYQSSLVSGF